MLQYVVSLSSPVPTLSLTWASPFVLHQQPVDINCIFPAPHLKAHNTGTSIKKNIYFVEGIKRKSPTFLFGIRVLR